MSPRTSLRTSPPVSPASLRADELVEQLSRLALVESTLGDLLQNAVRIVSSAMPAESETSAALQDDGTAVSAATGPRARRLDDAQFAAGRGPGVHAWHAGALVEIADARADDRWPEHAARAAGAGLLSSVSVPLFIDARTGGALTVWADAADGIDAEMRLIVRRLAPHLRAAVIGVQDRTRARAMADDLDVELETRAVIGQAKGILAERYRLSPERAVELLVRMSARRKVAVRDVAAGLVATQRRT